MGLLQMSFRCWWSRLRFRNGCCDCRLLRLLFYFRVGAAHRDWVSDQSNRPHHDGLGEQPLNLTVQVYPSARRFSLILKPKSPAAWGMAPNVPGASSLLPRRPGESRIIGGFRDDCIFATSFSATVSQVASVL